MNLFEGIDPTAAEEISTVLLQRAGLRIERIVSTGQVSPPDYWYDQKEHEWVVVLDGHAELRFADGRQVNLQKGDWVDIPAHTRHRVEFTDRNKPTIWLAVFYQDAGR